MQRAPIPSSSRTRSKAVQRPAPLKGLDVSTPITAIPEGNALRLENWVCGNNGLRTRNGCRTITSGYGGPIVSIMAHGNRLFCATNMQLFDGAAPIPGLTMAGGDWHHALMANPAGVFLIATNGGDGVRVFDGTAWSLAALDGVDPGSIVTLCVHQSRLWLVPRNSLTIYYLDLDCFSGPVHPVYLQPLCRKGGSVAAIASMTGDGGINAANRLVVATDRGELIVWSGVDPAKDFQQTGVYAVPPPVGRRCFSSYGAGLAYLSKSGVLPVPDILPRPDNTKAFSSLSQPINTLLTPALATGSWSLTQSILSELFIVSGPAGQYVRSETDGWSSFTGLGATCWVETPGGLYFGTASGTVCSYEGSTDDGTAINSYLVDRFDRMGTVTRKSISEVRPLYTAALNYRPRLQMLANYVEPPATFAARFTNAGSYQWEDISWGMQPAGWNRPTTSRQALWRGCSGEGTAFALSMGLKTKTPVVYTGYDLQFETGASL